MLVLLVWVKVSQSQVAIAPTAVFLDKNGVGTLYVTNNSSQPQEISISFHFGYTSENEQGNLYIRFDDTLRQQKFGIENVKAFPKTFILPANQQQLVRIQARMPKDKPDATYFSRIKIATSAQVSDVGQSGNADGISTRVNVRFEQVIALFYKHGTTTTGIKVEKLEGTADASKRLLLLSTQYTTQGNSPFIGRCKTVLKDSDGKVVLDQQLAAVYYFNGVRKSALSLPEDFKSGKYTIEIIYETTRTDIAAEDLVKAQPYTYKTTLNL